MYPLFLYIPARFLPRPAAIRSAKARMPASRAGTPPSGRQPQISVLLSLAEGTSTVYDDIFDNRFRYVSELRRMGADISVDGKVAVIHGGSLKGAPVKATDLRAGAAMIIAGLAAGGVTEISDIYHIERGYEAIEDKLKAIGADIKRVYVPMSSDMAMGV